MRVCNWKLLLWNGMSRTREELSREMERVVREFEGSGTGRVSVVLDRVAALVPPAVNLDMLVVNPLLKGLEEGKSVDERGMP